MHLKKPTSNLNNYVLQVSGIDGARTYTAGVAHILIQELWNKITHAK